VFVVIIFTSSEESTQTAEMELSGSDCEGANSVTSLNFVLSDPVGNGDLIDGENNLLVPLVLSGDFEIGNIGLQKLFKTANGEVQVVLIDSSQVFEIWLACERISHSLLKTFSV